MKKVIEMIKSTSYKFPYNSIDLASILLVIFLAINLISFGQVQQNLDRDHNEQVTIIGSYDPSINEAFKLNFKPEEKAFDFQKPNFTFTALESQSKTTITLEPIKPLAIRADDKPVVYDNYLLAGFGSLITPFVDFTHSHGAKNDYRFNFHLNSLSSFANIPDYAPSTFSSSLLELSYDHYLKNHSFTTSFKYGLNTNKFYGFRPADLPENVAENFYQNQMFNLIRANAGIKSNYSNDDKLNHQFDLSGYYYFDKYKTTETSVKFDFDLFKSFNVNKMLNYQYLGLKTSVNYYGNKDSLASTSDLLVQAIPYFKARYGVFSFNIGLNLYYLNTTSGKFKIYPMLDLTINLVPEMITVYGGFGGGLTKNSFLNISTINPWVSSVIPLEWKNERISMNAGIRGNLARKVNFNLQIDWTSFENEYFFINTGDYAGILLYDPPMNKFTAVYDDGSVFKVSGELGYVYSENLKMWLGGNYQAFSLDSLSKPYQKTLSMIKFGASYLFKKKASIRAEIYSYGKRYALNDFGQEVTMNGFIDINLGSEYFIKDNFSVFLNLTNLLNDHYQRFFNYPVQGFQVMAGIGYKF